MSSRSRFLGLLLAGLAASLLLMVGVALAVLPPGGTFTDDNGNTHEGNIEAIAAEGITLGCNPPTNDRYCPTNAVTRGQMAAFLNRAFNFLPSDVDYFDDDNGTTFEDDINAIAKAGITQGCNPPANNRYCPSGQVTRGQMAAFLNRTFKYPAATIDYFNDDNTSVFETDINAIARAGITLGCNPPTNDRYCPSGIVRRDQMASFLARAMGLTPIVPPPSPTTTTTTTPGPDYLLDAQTCNARGYTGGIWTYRYTADIENRTSSTHSYRVDIEFRDNNGFTFGTGNDTASNVAPGATGPLTVSSLYPEVDGFTCWYEITIDP